MTPIVFNGLLKMRNFQVNRIMASLRRTQLIADKNLLLMNLFYLRLNLAQSGNGRLKFRLLTPKFLALIMRFGIKRAEPYSQ